VSLIFFFTWWNKENRVLVLPILAAYEIERVVILGYN